MAPSSFQQTCPNCTADLKIKAALIGKKWTCPECQRPFVVEEPESEAEERQEKRRETGVSKERKSENGPSSRITNPGRSKSRKSAKKRPANSVPKGWLIGGGVAAALVLIGGVAAIFWPRRSPPATPAPASFVSDPTQGGLASPMPAADQASPGNPTTSNNTPSVPARARAVPWIDTLSDNLGTYYLVSNGPIQFQLYTSGALTGKMASLKYQDREMLDDKNKGSAEVTGSFLDSTTKKSTPFSFAFGANTSFSYRTGPDFIDVAMHHAAEASNPLDVAFHYVVRKEEGGLHFYAALNHEASRPTVSVSQARLMINTDEKLFRYASVEEDRSGYEPTSAELARGRRVNADTIDMRDVKSEYTKAYHTKYQWAVCARDHAVDGLVGPDKDAGSNHGIWCVWTNRSKEAMHGGPTRWQPTVNGNALVYEYASAHQEGGVALECAGNYQKTYGPFFIYLNKGNDLKSLRADANRQTDPKIQQRFYDQLAIAGDVKSSERSTVTGQVRLSDGASMDGAVVVLSTFDPQAKRSLDNEFQRQSKGFNYWTSTGKDGRFTLKLVRPGLYRLTVYKPDLYYEFHHDNVRVRKGAPLKIQPLTWKPDANGKTLWQIGTFDRSAAEFKHGDEIGNWYAAFDFNKDFPNAVPGDAGHPRGAVVYTVDPGNATKDANQWRTNWNYLQWRSFPYKKPDPNNASKVVEDANAKKETQPAGTEPDWVVKFQLDKAPAAKATCTLSIGLAAAHGVSNLKVQIGSNHLDFPLEREDDSSSLRNGVPGRALYQKRTFPGSWLKQGTNTFVFNLDGGELMYDAVRLEMRGDVATTPFTLKVEPGHIKLKGGGAGTITVVATRKDYQGPISVELRNLPGHVTATKAVIPAGQNRIALQITADANAARVDRPDVYALGTATASSNKQVSSGHVTVSVLAKTGAKPPKPPPVKKPKTGPEKKTP